MTNANFSVLGANNQPVRSMIPSFMHIISLFSIKLHSKLRKINFFYCRFVNKRKCHRFGSVFNLHYSMPPAKASVSFLHFQVTKQMSRVFPVCKIQMARLTHSTRRLRMFARRILGVQILEVMRY